MVLHSSNFKVFSMKLHFRRLAVKPLGSRRKWFPAKCHPSISNHKTPSARQRSRSRPKMKSRSRSQIRQDEASCRARSDNCKGAANVLLTWSCQSYDGTSNLADTEHRSEHNRCPLSRLWSLQANGFTPAVYNALTDRSSLKTISSRFASISGD
jgi:hypothetical protein